MPVPTYTQSQLLGFSTVQGVFNGDGTTTTGWGVTVEGTEPANVHYPVTVNNGDTAFLVVCTRTIVGSCATPSGWDAVAAESVHSTSGMRVAVFYRRCDGSESDATVSVDPNSGGVVWCGVIFTVSGAIASGNPTEGYDAVITGNSQTGTESPATTTTGPDRLLVRIYAVMNDNRGNYAGVSAWSAPSGWDYRIGLSTSYGTDMEFAIDTRSQATADTVASTTRGGGGTNTTYDVAVGFAIVPEPSGSSIAPIAASYYRMLGNS